MPNHAKISAGLDWTRISKNPVSPEVLAFIRDELRKRRGARVFDLMDFLCDFVKDKTVLDIGVVEHDISHIESSGWKHRQIIEHANHVTGIDILSEEVELLQKRGFNVLEVDATSDIDLDLRVDRVFIGDVIEHVDNPVSLLKFAARHLLDDGLILVTTPNPFCFFRPVFKEGTFLANAEHISWISPSHALELGRRADLHLIEYRQLQSRGVSIAGKIYHMIRDMFWADSELFAAGFCYLYAKFEK